MSNLNFKGKTKEEIKEELRKLPQKKIFKRKRTIKIKDNSQRKHNE